MNPIGEKYLRKDFLPMIFCPGCGDGMIVQALAHAAEELKLGDDLTLTAGIGCSAWIPMYLHADVLKVLHGRAIPAAVGLKATRPARKVVTVTGEACRSGQCQAQSGQGDVSDLLEEEELLVHAAPPATRLRFMRSAVPTARRTAAPAARGFHGKPPPGFLSAWASE